MQDSPLHPFELHPYVNISLFGLDISLNKAVIMMWVVIVLAAWFLIAASRQRRLIPGRLQSIGEMFVEFLQGVILDTIGKEGMRFFPFIATLFIFILFSNWLGLIPGSYTVTSQIVVTAAFALFVYTMSLVVGLVYHGPKFLRILIPPGTPWWLLWLMMPIELVSQLARPVSLSVRLFANMTAGHTILAVLFGMVISIPLIPLPLAAKILLLVLIAILLASRHKILAAAGILGLVGMYFLIAILVSLIWVRWLPFAATLFVNGLEMVLIAPIQAYIFTVLTCVYLGDAINLHGQSEEAH